MTNDMTLARVRQLVEAYGADPKRWSEAERRAAEKLIGSLINPAADADAARREAAELDALLDRWKVEPPDRTLARRIVAAAEGVPQRRPGELLRTLQTWLAEWFGTGPRWPQLAGLTAALLIGLTIGISDLASLDTSAAGEIDDGSASIATLEAGL
ncbi:MAG TPA: hypothetical protein VEU47_07865 [Candidatus Cybelea sp.]|nr:hypothetical protein [Candidatus Cybelea sp.]